ncbi:MAG: type II and III secretion system protein family protein [Pseudomonadota bacterium]
MVISPTEFKGCKLSVLFLAFIVLLIFSPRCFGEDSVSNVSEAVSHQKIPLVVGETTVIKVKSPHLMKRISVGTPTIADAIIMSTTKDTYPKHISLIGKAPGITNVTLWGKNNEVFAILDLEVSPNISRLKEVLHEVLPEEKEIRITANHDNITLSGTVSSASNLSQVLAIAESYAPKKIITLVEVSGVHQVMLEVRVSEMSRSVMKRLGVNFNYFRGADFGLSLLGGLTSIGTISSTGVSTINVGTGTNAIFRFHQGDATWTGFIDALKENGLVKILAEPTLISLSGQTASFLAGGEIPIPVPQKDNVTIDYKAYGVGLTFTPTVLNNGKISVKVAPEVSELDYSNVITIYGYVVPALNTRRASTVIELADGQSFAIAGLIKETHRNVVTKFPLLGDIPILGALFRSTNFQKNETELVIIVTPHLVKPLDMAKQTLPTDQYVEPDDFEFYLLGALEGRGKSPLLNDEGGMEGEFGHAAP